MQAVPLVVLLDGGDHYLQAALLQANGYEIFSTEHVVEVCLRWISGRCAALVVGTPMARRDVSTLCQWVKVNSPGTPVILLTDRHSLRIPSYIDAVADAVPADALVDVVRTLLGRPRSNRPRFKGTASTRVLPLRFQARASGY